MISLLMGVDINILDYYNVKFNIQFIFIINSIIKYLVYVLVDLEYILVLHNLLIKSA